MTVLVIFLLSLVKSTYFSQFGFGLVDEGQHLHNSLKLLSGLLPYKDFFAVFPPLHYYLYSLSVELFGTSVIYPRLLSSFIFSFSPPLLYLICKQHSNHKLALFSALFLIFSNVNVERFYFFTPLLLSIYQMDKLKPILSGILFGISCLFRIDISLAFFLSYFITNPKKAIPLAIGLSIPIVSLFAWLAANGIVRDFVSNTIIESVIISRLHDLPFPFPYSLQSAYVSAFAYTILSIFVLSLIKVLTSSKVRQPMLYWLLSGAFTLPYMLGRTDMGHLIKGGLPFIILGSLLVSSIEKPLLKFISATVVIFLFAGLLFESFWWVKFNNQATTIANYNLKLNPTHIPGTTVASADTIKRSTLFLAETNGNVLTLPYMAGLYFLSDKTSPTRYDNVLYGYLRTPEDENEFIKYLLVNDTKRIVYDPIIGPKAKVSSFKEYNPIIHNFIASNYRTIHTTPEGWLFLEKK